MKLLLSLICVVSSLTCIFGTTIKTDNLLFVETFDVDPFAAGKWVKSLDSKYVDDDANNNPAVKIGPSSIAAKGFESDKGLRLTKEHKHYGFGSKFPSPISFKDNSELVFQYELKLEEQLNCGGAYIKLLRDTPDFDLTKLNGDTPYSIMFGPDKCGSNNKIHFIFPHQNPLTQVWEEKHLNETSALKGDKRTHLYTLSLQDDNTFTIYIDKIVSKKGSLLTHMKPAINPPAEIDDPTDSKPEDWVDEVQIDDPTAFKPDDWDETAPKMIPNEDAVKPAGWLDDGPKSIPDPNAVKPDDWDDEQDGEWEAPQIDNPDCEKFGCGEWKRPLMKNPAYKGIWKAPRIPNPAYKGPWKARQIPNPERFEDLTPAKGMHPIAALAVEVWTINGGLHFDNFIVARSLQDAWAFADETFSLKQSSEASKEKKEKKENAKASRNELRTSDSIKDKATALFYDAVDFVQDQLETNFAAVVGSAAAFVILVFYLCLPSQKPGKGTSKSRASVDADDAKKDVDSSPTPQANRTEDKDAAGGDEITK